MYVFRVLLGRTFVSGLRTKNLKTFFQNLGFFPALVIVYKNVGYTAIVMPAMPSLHGNATRNLYRGRRRSLCRRLQLDIVFVNCP